MGGQAIHGKCRTRIYRIWDAMRRRSTRKYAKACYAGITTCKEWQKFLPFYWWATENGYTDDLIIDRIDSAKGYSPDNCRWTTYTENNRNRRGVRFTMEAVRKIRQLVDGGMLQREVAKIYKVKQGQISTIVNGKSWKEVA